MRPKNILTLALAVLACAAGHITYRATASPPRRPAYTMERQVYNFRDGQPQKAGRETIRGHSDERFSIERIDRNGARELFRPESRSSVVTAAQLRASKQFLRTDVLLGFEAYVMDSDNGVELWRLPALGGDIAKIVVRDPDDGTLVQVIEPERIDLGEPAEQQPG